MTRDWEATLLGWSKGPGPTEQTKMENAERGIRAAIDASAALGSYKIAVFAQGSYKNNTTVPRDSDVDICVVCKDVVQSDWSVVDPNQAPGVRAAVMKEAGMSPATYTYEDFKRDVGAALVARFGLAAVKRGDKAWDVHENTYRVEADVVAALEYRRWKRGEDGVLEYTEGIHFRSDAGKVIINWPAQHYANGVAKNSATNREFKAMTRILKNLCNEMSDGGVAAAGLMASFLLECIAYNVPDADYGKPTWIAQTKHVIAHAWEATKADASCKDWVEVSWLKWLFRPSQPWTREQAHNFLYAAWNYEGLGKA